MVCGVWGLGCVDCVVYDVRCGVAVWEVGCGVCYFGCRVCYVGCGVRGVVFWVWNVGHTRYRLHQQHFNCETYFYLFCKM